MTKHLTYNVNGSFESLMMGFGEKKWESFQMMSALDFLRCYDPKFMMPEEYVQQILAKSSRKYDEAQLEQARENWLSDYLQKFKTRLKEIVQSSDLTSKFYNLPDITSV